MTNDWLHFDGSANPNPGGPMGWGWSIQWAAGTATSGTGKAGPGQGNSNNVAEYRALLDGLQAYLEAGGRGPLVVQGDSQLVINQVQGLWKVKTPSLAPLVQTAQQRIEEIRRRGGAVTIQWVRRERNTGADMLSKGMDPNAPPPQRMTLPDDELLPVGAELRESIARLNRHPDPGFGDYAGLKVGGRDAASALGLRELRQRAGDAISTQIAEALPDERQQASALRWVLRGLAAELAVGKCAVDDELRRRAEMGKQRGR